MATEQEARELELKIAALKESGIDTASDESDLAAMRAELGPKPGAGPQPEATPVAEATKGPVAPVSEATGDSLVWAELDGVDPEAFDKGGQAFSSPPMACTVRGRFVEVSKHSDGPHKNIWVFQTDDPTLEQQHRSGITVTTDGAGAFKMKDILVSMGFPFERENGKVKYAVEAGRKCTMTYTEQVVQGKDQIRLDSVHALGTVEGL